MRRVLCLSLLLIGPAGANDTVVYGAGADVYPIENAQVAMAKETLTIEQIGPWRGAVRGWRVTVRYEFQNTSDQALKLQIGFPEQCGIEPGGEAPETEGNACRVPGLHDFTTRVDGAPRTVAVKRFKAEKSRALPHRTFGRLHTFEVVFAGKQRRVVEHTYWVGGYADSSMGSGVEYILQTGALWAGPIGTLDIEVISKTKHGRVGYGSGVDALPPPVFEGWRDGTYQIRWALKRYEPKADLDIYLSSPAARETFIELQDLMSAVATDAKATLAGKTKEALRVLRNLPHAIQGYRFQNAALRAHFAKTPWYVPRADFDPQWISAEEHAFIKAIKAFERENGMR